MSRDAYVIVAVGKRRSGKTTSVLRVAEASKKRVLVIDVSYHPRYADWEQVNITQLPKWKGKQGLLIIQVDELERVIQTLITYHKEMFVIIEDSQRLIEQNMPKYIKSFIIDNRKHGFDIAFMYHALKLVPPFIAMQYNSLIIHKTGDPNSNEIGSKFANWEAIKNRKAIVDNHKNEHWCEVVYDTEIK